MQLFIYACKRGLPLTPTKEVGRSFGTALVAMITADTPCIAFCSCAVPAVMSPTWISSFGSPLADETLVALCKASKWSKCWVHAAL